MIWKTFSFCFGCRRQVPTPSIFYVKYTEPPYGHFDGNLIRQMTIPCTSVCPRPLQAGRKPTVHNWWRNYGPYHDTSPYIVVCVLCLVGEFPKRQSTLSSCVLNLLHSTHDPSPSNPKKPSYIGTLLSPSLSGISSQTKETLCIRFFLNPFTSVLPCQNSL